MRRLLVAAILALLLPVAGVAAQVPAAPDPARIAIGFDALPDGLGPGSLYHGWRIVAVDAALSAATAQRRSASEPLADLRLLPEVRYAEPDVSQSWLLEDAAALLVPDDTFYAAAQYAPQLVGAPAAWSLTTGSTAAAVCIVDTGILSTHQDLAGARWMGGTDAIAHDGVPNDANGHGTHVAGIAAATLDNGRGIAGMGNVALYAARVLDANGAGPASAIAAGIRWCADNAPRQTVINLSLGSGAEMSIVTDAIAYARGKGNLVVAAAGNDGGSSACNDDDCVSWPAADPGVVAVSCVDADGLLCGYSSTGPQVDIAAPGDDILSTWNSGTNVYAWASGTSMAAPLVSGAAALLWSREPTLTAADVRERLLASAQDQGPAGVDRRFGHGLLDAGCLLTCPTDADLRVVVGGNATGLTGEAIPVTVTVANDGPGDVAAATLTLRLSRVLAAPPANCTLARATLTCALGAIPAGEEASLGVGVSSARAAIASVRASVTAALADANLSNNAATRAIAVRVPSADVDANITAAPMDANATEGPGRNVTLRLANDGPQQPGTARLALRLPSRVTANATLLPEGCLLASRTLVCTATDLAAPAEWVVRLEATRTGTYTLQAQASSPLKDPVPADNRARLAVALVAPPLPA